MRESVSIEKLKIKIESKRDQLNGLVTKDIKRDKLLKFSIELDQLISEYYNLELKMDEK